VPLILCYLDLLLMFVERCAVVLHRQEIFDRVWSDVVVRRRSRRRTPGACWGRRRPGSSGPSRGTATSSCARCSRARTGPARRSRARRAPARDRERPSRPIPSATPSRGSSTPRRPTRRSGTRPRSFTRSGRRRPCGAWTAGPATRGPGRTCATAGGTSRAPARCLLSAPAGPAAGGRPACA
jgi:hypothetical protein